MKNRDRNETRRRIVQATIQLIREKGLDSVGVNAVAREAGVSKVLIYRYFGDLPGLLEVVGRELDPAGIAALPAEIGKRIVEGGSLPETLRQTVLAMKERLESDGVAMNLMAWEMLYDNEVTRAFAQTREEAGVRLNRELQRLIPVGSDFDVEAVFAVFSSALYYLLLRSRFVRNYSGIDIQSDDGWRRIAGAMGDMLAGLIREK